MSLDVKAFGEEDDLLSLSVMFHLVSGLGICLLGWLYSVQFNRIRFMRRVSSRARLANIVGSPLDLIETFARAYGIDFFVQSNMNLAIAKLKMSSILELHSQHGIESITISQDDRNQGVVCFKIIESSDTIDKDQKQIGQDLSSLLRVVIEPA
jgi:hypothetical protein